MAYVDRKAALEELKKASSLRAKAEELVGIADELSGIGKGSVDPELPRGRRCGGPWRAVSGPRCRMSATQRGHHSR